MAVRIVLKRSSIPNKRPNPDLLDPGELALNTNALTPGLFFEADNNSIIKVGPTAVSPTIPLSLPSLGETHFNQITKELNVGNIDPDTALSVWSKVAAPYLGGTDGFVVFVAPEFPSSSDSVFNDGQSSPFKTINRAVIEVAKRSIRVNNEGDLENNSRFVIYVAPGICPVYNGPGLPLPTDTNVDNIQEFNVVFEGEDPSDPNVLNLQAFNPVSGGLPLPRGTSILGMDLRKVELRPSYVPSYKNPTTGAGINQPTAAVIKWTGNSYVNSLSFRDKRSVVSINAFGAGPAGEGVFVSSRPHCFGLNDQVFFEFSAGADQRPVNSNSGGVLSGTYYVYPLGPDTFYLSYAPITDVSARYIERDRLPAYPQTIGILATCTWEGRSHNRLRCLFPAQKTELDEFYIKVQRAYPTYFLGKSNQAEVVNPGETEIVAPVYGSTEASTESNSTNNSSPYVENVSVRSNYGLCGLENDGSLVTGFRTALGTSFSVISIQNDPAAYEIYTTVQDPITGEIATKWYTLQYATWATLPPASRPPNAGLVSKQQQLQLLNNTALTNIRFYFTTQTSQDGLSFGLPDLQNDFRHFAVRCTEGAYAQIDTGWSVGCAVGYWGFNGGKITVTNSSSNFGMNAIRSEGFKSIGSNVVSTITDPADSNFIFSGIRMPEKLSTRNTTNSTTFALGASIESVQRGTAGVQLIKLGSGFQPVNILPFSLAPNTAIYSITGAGSILRAFFIDDGRPTVVFNNDGSCTLRVRLVDTTFPIGTPVENPSMVNWSMPYIRRWVDPRNVGEASYSLILTNTNQGHRQPKPGAILRLNQNSAAASNLLRPGVQFDPGPNGGWGRIFQIAYTETQPIGNSPVLNEVLLNRSTKSNVYYAGLNLCDSARPWEPEFDNAHGNYTTFGERNWYAASNSQWDQVYYSNTDAPIPDLKPVPTEFNSPWAITFSSELQQLVEETYQGEYAKDPRKDKYPTGTYFRGDVQALDNYGFELVVNQDNGTPNFGLIRNNVPTTTKTTITETLTPLMTNVTVASLTGIPDPQKEFVVMELESGDRSEYVQVIAINKESNNLDLIRGLYGTKINVDWTADTEIVLQSPSDQVDESDYDFDWSISKSSIIRFLQVLGYSDEAIGRILAPQFPSNRNLLVGSISDQPEKDKGYAVATGSWPFEFASPSQVDAISHSFHSVGRFNYSRGLPQYLKNELPTKQYYDNLSTQIWGGAVLLTGADELGNLPTTGEQTQAQTGRPAGSYTSNIASPTRVNPEPDGGGGGGGGGGVQAIFTGEGISGGPITTEGTISIRPASAVALGGVKQGAGITIAADGTISAAGGGGSVTSITAGIGLEGGTITTTGTIDLKPPTPATANGPAEIGGIYPDFGLNFDPDTGALNVNITNDLNGNAQDFAISQFAANALEKQVQALTGANILAGTFDANFGKLVTVTPAGARNGFIVGQNVPAPSTAIDNYYVIVTKGGTGAVAPLPTGYAGPGDWYICQAEAGVTPVWLLIDFELVTTTASSVVVTPPIAGIDTAGNVQTALQAIELQVQDRIEFVQVQDEQNTNALFADVTAPSPTANDGTTLKIGVLTASTAAYGVTKLTNDFSGTSQDLALTQFAANQINSKLDALVGANVLAGTYNAAGGVVSSTTPAGAKYLTVGQNCPAASLVPDNYYVLVTNAGDKGPPGAIIPVTGVQSGDWFVCERSGGASPAEWITIDFENSGVPTASQIKLVPAVPGIQSDNVQGGITELVTKTNNAFTDIVSATGDTSGIKVTNSAAGVNGRTSTLQLLPATAQDIGGVFAIPGSGLNLSVAGALSLAPPTAGQIGGVKAGAGIEIGADGTIRATGGGGGAPSLLDSITAQFDGTRVSFQLTVATVAYSPTNAQSVLIVIGGVVQPAGTAYSVSGSTITFTAAPPTGVEFYGLGFSGS
jgi:hypothetical protein